MKYLNANLFKGLFLLMGMWCYLPAFAIPAGAVGAAAGAQNGTTGGKYGKCPVPPPKFSKKECRELHGILKPKVVQRTYKDREEAFYKNLDKIHQDNQAHYTKNLNTSIKSIHNQFQCYDDVRNAILRDCANASAAQIRRIRRFLVSEPIPMQYNSHYPLYFSYLSFPQAQAALANIVENYTFSKELAVYDSISANLTRLHAAESDMAVTENAEMKIRSLEQTAQERKHLDETSIGLAQERRLTQEKERLEATTSNLNPAPETYPVSADS